MFVKNQFVEQKYSTRNLQRRLDKPSKSSAVVVVLFLNGKNHPSAGRKI
jgi:hypothetical protein